MAGKKPRKLNEEESALWKRVADTATPLDGRAKFAPTAHKKGPKKKKKQELSPAPTIQPFEIGSRTSERTPTHNLAPTLSSQMNSAPVAMDRKTFQKMKRGKTAPEAKIDLHGMTASAAHGALTSFILSSHAAGKRLVLVITGKGRVSNDSNPIPARIGVLRHQLPHWLSTPPLKSVVLQVAEAHQRHGGSGAFYVYLRRR